MLAKVTRRSAVGDQNLEGVNQPWSRPVEVSRSVQDDNTGSPNGVDFGSDQIRLSQRPIPGESAGREDQELWAGGGHVCP